MNPAVFIDQVGDAINQALYDQVAEGIVYTPVGRRSLDGRALQDRAPGRDGRQAGVRRRGPEEHHRQDRLRLGRSRCSCAEFLDARDDVPLFIKLPGWFLIPTPLGNYNPDWAFVRKEDAGDYLYLVRETKGTDKLEKLQWESEGWKIKFGKAHFDALERRLRLRRRPEGPHRVHPGAGRPVPDRPALWSPDEVEGARFTTHLPVYSLEAAAGYFGSGHDVELEGWIGGRPAAWTTPCSCSAVVGRSMEPESPTGRSACSADSAPDSRRARSFSPSTARSQIPTPVARSRSSGTARKRASMAEATAIGATLASRYSPKTRNTIQSFLRRSTRTMSKSLRSSSRFSGERKLRGVALSSDLCADDAALVDRLANRRGRLLEYGVGDDLSTCAAGGANGERSIVISEAP